jgi:hypothetical protein
MEQAIERVGPMRHPPHPGEVLNEMVIAPLGISVTDAADAIGVSNPLPYKERLRFPSPHKRR